MSRRSAVRDRPRTALISDATVDNINAEEAAAVAARASQYGTRPSGKNAVGLALSGGGIRSATFCLGVTQVLADRDLLKDVDFLSTVSGGGYIGSFLTRTAGQRQAAADVAGTARPRSGPDPLRATARQVSERPTISRSAGRW